MNRYRTQKGVILIVCMIFLCIFSALAVSLASMSNTNVQLANNQHKVNSTLNAALSALDCGKYITATVTLDETATNYVTDDEADDVWTDLCQHLQNTALGGKIVPAPTRFTDSIDSGDRITTPSINFGSIAAEFAISFYRYDADPNTIKLEGTGTDGQITRRTAISLTITKDSEVLNYAIASRGRMWLTGDSTIHGDIFSSWNRPEISPFNMTSDSAVLGTINTVIEKKYFDPDDPDYAGYHLETLDENGDPMFDEDGNRIYSDNDEVQAYHEGINYDQPDDTQMPGMDIADYDTDAYKTICTANTIAAAGTMQTEYFPHAAGDYTQRKSSSSRRLDRHVYEDQTFTDAYLPDDRNALFKNCTFDGILYIDCQKSGYHYNNARFENCSFNGTIVTDVPQQFKFKHNCLYFTGEATFENTSGIEQATILAPHFNVNLGNTNPEQSDNNILTGAIIGGIVDVRGNAQIYGTIISMCDTSQWSSGYVTNIGATLGDGGSETTEPGDVGVISITPEEDKMLPSGIKSPIVIKPLQNTYSEGF